MEIREAEQLFTYELGLKYLKDREKEEDFYFRPLKYDIPIRHYKDEFLELLKKDFKANVKYFEITYPNKINKELADLKSYCLWDIEDWTDFLIKSNVLIRTA